MSLKDKMREDEKNEHAERGGGWFKFAEGNNKIRVLEEPLAIYKDYKYGMCYTGCGFKGQMKYLSYVYDYGTGSIKLMEIPYGIFQTIAGWEQHEDYSFDGFPMPYDITVDATNAGTKEVKYSPVPRPVRAEMDEGILAQLSEKKRIPEVIEALKETNRKKHMADGTYDRLHDGSEQQDDGNEGKE